MKTFCKGNLFFATLQNWFLPSKNCWYNHIRNYFLFELIEHLPYHLFQNLIQEMRVRETQFNSVQDRGNSMVLDRHPQSKTIEIYMAEMQSQWSWLLQLSVCLDAHVKQASAYLQVFKVLTSSLIIQKSIRTRWH